MANANTFERRIVMAVGGVASENCDSVTIKSKSIFPPHIITLFCNNLKVNTICFSNKKLVMKVGLFCQKRIYNGPFIHHFFPSLSGVHKQIHSVCGRGGPRLKSQHDVCLSLVSSRFSISEITSFFTFDPCPQMNKSSNPKSLDFFLIFLHTLLYTEQCENKFQMVRFFSSNILFQILHSSRSKSYQS